MDLGSNDDAYVIAANGKKMLAVSTAGEPLETSEGGVIVAGGSYSGNQTLTNITETPWSSLSIINDGAGNLTFTINSIATVIKPGESFYDTFNSFTSISIVTAGAFRIVLRS